MKLFFFFLEKAMELNWCN